jgi:hypothetical protein
MSVSIGRTGRAALRVVLGLLAMSASSTAWAEGNLCTATRLQTWPPYVTLTADKTEVAPGDTVNYTVSVTNPNSPDGVGICELIQLQVSLTLPASDGTASGTVVSIVSGASLAPGGSLTFPAVPYVVNVAGGIYNITAQASLYTGVVTPCGGGTLPPPCHFSSDTDTLSIPVVPPPPPEDQCTRTIGFWKTHAGFGPQPDLVTGLLPIWLGTPGGAASEQVTTAEDAVTILSTMGSNGINKLRAQLLGAKLNGASGADLSSVAETIAAADAFLATKSPTDWKSLDSATQQKVLGWMSTLDSYNNGLIGPRHCG